MNKCLALLRGVNVGGKNKVPMSELRECLVKLGFTKIATYIASGNIILESAECPEKIQESIEQALINNFKLDSELIKVLVISCAQLQAVIKNKPKGFGEQPGKYHSDAIFLINIDVGQAMSAFNPREGVDKIWPGNGIIYSQRLSSERTKSRLNKVMSSPLYKSMTIRNWNTTTKLMELIGDSC